MSSDRLLVSTRGFYSGTCLCNLRAVPLIAKSLWRNPTLDAPTDIGKTCSYATGLLKHLLKTHRCRNPDIYGLFYKKQLTKSRRRVDRFVETRKLACLIIRSGFINDIK